MTDLLLELFSEEIPAGMQEKAATALEESLAKKFTESNLKFSGAVKYFTPRRITLLLQGLPDLQPDVSVERKGPKVGANEKAMEGFLKSTGLAVEQLEKRQIGGDEYYFACAQQKGRPAAEVIKEIIQEVMAGFTWPKSMRWGDRTIRWVRPLQSILCLFGDKVISVKFGHLEAGRATYGHRFMAPEKIEIANPSEYGTKLNAGKVIVDSGERKKLILAQIKEAAAKENLVLREDAGLLDEVAGLVEWPCVLIGKFEQEFMELPEEVPVTVMKKHQRYFALEDKSGKMAPAFVIVSNNIASDGGAKIIAGNQRVIRARLSDARFFWDQDRKAPLEQRNEKLKTVIFHAKVGTIAEKVERIGKLAELLAGFVPGADKALCARAAMLSKADLATDMVGEFGELQGLMGRYYALGQGEKAEVANAIKDHYKPLGQNDDCPKEPVSVVVALADKLDTLISMFAAGEKPTGSGDPYALRRAALGVIRIILENGIRLPLVKFLQDNAVNFLPAQLKASFKLDEIREFFADRLKNYLRSQDIKHFVISSVFDQDNSCDLVMLTNKSRMLSTFLETEDGKNLLAAYRRATNIVKIEEKKDGKAYSGAPESSIISEPAEKELFSKLSESAPLIEGALKSERFEEAMKQLAHLRAPIDKFFDSVIVNADNDNVRRNRLLMLSQMRTVLNQVANFSLIEE